MSQEREDYREPEEPRWLFSDRMWFAFAIVLCWSMGLAILLWITFL